MSQNMISRRMLKQLLKYMNENEIVKLPADEILSKIEELETAHQQQAAAPKQEAEAPKTAKKAKKASDSDSRNIEEDEVTMEQILHELCSETGWSRIRALYELGNAKTLYGIGPAQYCRYSAYSIPKENFKAIYDERVALVQQEREERQAQRNREGQESREEAVQAVMRKTGWTREKALAEMKEARDRTGCWMGQYNYFHFYELSHEEQETYLTQTFSNSVSKIYDSSKYVVGLFVDKERSNYFFADYIKRPWCVNTKVSEEEFVKIFRNTDKLFYKPLHNHHGTGAEPIDLTKESAQSAYARLKDYEEGVVEGYVKQHKKMMALAPNAVNTLRIVTVSSNSRDVGEPGKRVDVAYVSLKLSGETGVVDNLAGGGMVAAVDMATGRICTDAVDENDNVYVVHPVSGMTIKGFEVPFFQEALDMVCGAIKRFKLEGYFGWDVAITDEGPELIEPNNIPGTVLGQLPYVPEKKGIRHVIAKYI